MLATAVCDIQAEKVHFRVLLHAYGAWRAWTDCAVIRIRYKDFSAGTHNVTGLHGRVEPCVRGATIYLLPGLTAGQRRAVIRRLRQEASRGFGPSLPLPQLVIALGLDRTRTAAGTVRAIVRLHPAVTLVPSAFVLAIVTLFVMACGDRPGMASGTGGGLADAAAVSGSVAQIVSARPYPARVTRVTPRDKAPVRMPVRRGAWYVCPHAITAASRPREGQLACRPLAPHTAQLPGPLDFAW
jgi:hypothetical protein